MKLYYAPGACSLANIIILKELGLPCEFVSVNLSLKMTGEGESYFKINPKGSVPALLTHENIILTETQAIQLYLAEYGRADQLIPAANHSDRYQILSWISFCCTDLHKACISALYNPKITEQLKQDFYLPMLIRKLDYVDQHFRNRDYLIGENFCLADANLFVILNWLKSLNIEIKQFPNLHFYYERLLKRPSVVEALLTESQ